MYVSVNILHTKRCLWTENLGGKMAMLACIFLSRNIFICNIESLGSFFMKLNACTRVKIWHKEIVRHKIVDSVYTLMSKLFLLFVRRTIRLAFCQWLAQTWLVILTRTQRVSQWEETYGSWLKLIVNAGSLTKWCARTTVSHL